MTDQKNTILAIVLSALVLIAWQYFVGMPQMEKQKQEAQLKAQQQQQQVQTPGQQPGQPAPAAPGSPAHRRSCPAKAPRRPPGQQLSREAVLKASPRIPIDTPRLRGSIALKGARIDDLALTQYRETVDPKSPPIVLLSPSGSPHPFYAEFGWVGAAGATVKLPDRRHRLAQQGRRARRRPAGDAHLRQRRRPGIPPHHRGRRQVPVHGRGPGREQGRGAGHALSLRADLAPRHAGDARLLHPARRPDRRARRQGCRKSPTATIEDKKNVTFKATNAWLGITDKYWAATLIPDTKAPIQAQFSSARPARRRPTRPTISATRRPSRRARPARPTHAAVRRRQGGRGRRRLREAARSSTASSC